MFLVEYLFVFCLLHFKRIISPYNKDQHGKRPIDAPFGNQLIDPETVITYASYIDAEDTKHISLTRGSN